MASFEPPTPGTGKPTTCLIVTAGIGMVDTIDRLKAELETSDLVHVVATPVAAEWMKAGGLTDEIEALTGSPLEWTYRSPWDTKPSTMYNRCVVAPLTLNTLTKWAGGQPDNLALSMLCEAAWTDGVEVVAHLTLNGAYASHPAANPAIDVLHNAGVKIIPFRAGTEMKKILAATYGSNQVPANLNSAH